jgi:hypothetical protein
MIYQQVAGLDLHNCPLVDAVTVILTPDERTVAAYQATYVDSVTAISLALAGHPVQRIVVISSTAVCKLMQASSDGTINEHSPLQTTAHNTFAGTTPWVLYQAELAWQQACSALASQPMLTILRPSGIYSDDHARLRRLLASPTPPNMSLDGMSHRIHRMDVVGIIQHVHGMALPPALLICTDDKPEPLYQYLHGLAGHLQLPLPAWLSSYQATIAPGARYSNALLKQTGYQLRFAKSL